MPDPDRGEGWGPKEWAGAARLLTLTTQLGITIAAPIVAGVIGGSYVDEWLGAQGICAALFAFVGVAAGGYGAFRLLMGELRWKP
ncbi:MAG TPA: AtpZ/AtpI family protein [Candidatus Hydrogenedentes bacterium]|nr:AtpZ/AtpI family protein [Candidatus Hydrogenedentota bacterium]